MPTKEQKIKTLQTLKSVREQVIALQNEYLDMSGDHDNRLLWFQIGGINVRLNKVISNLEMETDPDNSST